MELRGVRKTEGRTLELVCVCVRVRGRLMTTIRGLSKVQFVANLFEKWSRSNEARERETEFTVWKNR